MADNKLQSLSEIFNQKIFRIPDFQRGYSWQRPQLEDFWEDLTNLKENKIHYTGLLTVEPVDKKIIEANKKWQADRWLSQSGSSAYYIVDGQQRLTTVIIFINELLKCFEHSERINFKKKDFWETKFLYDQYGEDVKYKSYIFGYEKDNPSDEYFKTKILGQKSSTADKVPEQTLYTANLKFAKEFFSKKFQEFKSDKTLLEDLFKKVTNSFKFNFYEIDDELDVYVTFETMNNRGMPLSKLELLKNRLIYLTTLLDGEERDQLRRDINETWKTIYEYLGKNQDKPLKDDDFLYHHWIMYFKFDKSESGAYSKFLLSEKFTVRNVVDKKLISSDIKNYIDSLRESVKCWFYLFNPERSDYEDETKEWFHKLSRLGMAAFSPLIMAAMLKCSEDEILRLLQSAEKFIFLVFRLSQRRSNTKSNDFYRLANSFCSEKEGQDIDRVIEHINSMTEVWVEKEDGMETIYYRSFNLEQFGQHIKEQYKTGEGYYTWNGLPYFLYEYELRLQEKAKGNQKVSWTDFKKEESIEHIYPRTAKDKSWRKSFAGYSKMQKERLLHSLGNLVLLPQSKNSQLQNKPFEFKKRHTNKNGNTVGYFNGSYSQIDVAKNENWTPDEIYNRGKELIAFLGERWGIDFKVWGLDEGQLLQLDFLQNSKDG